MATPTHYQNLLLRDGNLTAELWGRVVWIVHGICHQAQTPEHACRIDFPGLNALGIGFMARLYGSPSAIQSVVDAIQPLITHDLLSVQAMRPVPESPQTWAVSYRRKEITASKLRRMLRRRRHDDPGTFSEDDIEAIVQSHRNRPSHRIQMVSTSKQTRFNMDIERQLVTSNEAQRLADTPKAGANYGLGYPVPIIDDMGA